MRESATRETRAFRQRYRQTILGVGYSGQLHLISVFVAGGSGIAIAIWLASATWTAADLWVVPVTMIVANVVEYLAHRGPMHHRHRGLHALHMRHTGRHHRYFVHHDMAFESPRDFHAVLFPPVLLLFFGGINALLGLLVALFLPRSTAALFVATGLSYYLVYEVLHFLYHVPPRWRVSRIPGVRWLARLHRRHHDPQHMQLHNFNLVFPMCDWLAGTLDTGNQADTELSPHADHPLHEKGRPL